MRKLLFIFFLLPILIKSQNLVPNWSFETYTACPNASGQLPSATPWTAPTNNSSDYFNSCASVFNVPSYPGGFQIAKQGNAYSAIYLINGFGWDYREYLQAQLNDTLTSGKCYFIEFFASLDNSARYAVNNMAANLSKIQYINTGTGFVLNLPQNITKSNNPIIRDTLNWVQVSGIMIGGGEKFITIGNFKDNINTDTLTYKPGGYNAAYYLIDAVSVFSINPTGTLPWQYRDTTVSIGDSVYIGNTMGGTFTSNWYIYGGTFINSGSGIYVKPVTTSTYVVQFTVCGVPRSDTLKVTVTGVGIDENTLFSNSIVLYPQPAKDIVNISLNYFYEKSIEVRVVDVNGREVNGQQLIVNSGKAMMQISDLSDGVYAIQLKNSSGQVARKRLVVAR
ncbi:MAG: T9SS type A sorting domain-containing protein [Bacteroidia bacterium]|nr:T9SS type A sorting domain-containing protein [Bacteroidia bacterium]